MRMTEEPELAKDGGNYITIPDYPLPSGRLASGYDALVGRLLGGGPLWLTCTEKSASSRRVRKKGVAWSSAMGKEHRCWTWKAHSPGSTCPRRSCSMRLRLTKTFCWAPPRTPA